MRKPIKPKDQALPRPGENSQMDATVLARLAALQAMSVKELKEKWASLFATAAPNNSRAFLEVRIASRIQELTYGGLSRDTRRMLDMLADEVEGKLVRKPMAVDPRNPMPGMVVHRILTCFWHFWRNRYWSGYCLAGTLKLSRSQTD